MFSTDYKERVFISLCVEPFEVEKQLFIAEVATTQYNELWDATYGKEAAEVKVLMKKRQVALEAVTEAKMVLDGFVLASHHLEKLQADLDHANYVKEVMKSYRADAIRLEAVLDSLIKQAHLVPVAEAAIMEVGKLKGYCDKCRMPLKENKCRTCAVTSWTEIDTSVPKEKVFNDIDFIHFLSDKELSKHGAEVRAEATWHMFKYGSLDDFEVSDALTYVYDELVAEYMTTESDGMDRDGDLF